jgi:glycosyltransferase involved in cell wall biosynthesis
MANMTPLVSILIPCYNAGPWIAQCIQSALDQTYANKEIVVIDDGSSDNSLEIIQSFGDRIRVETGPNRGAQLARNRLLKLCTGDWLNFLDADDYLLPSKVAKQIECAQQRQDVDVVYSPMLDLYPSDHDDGDHLYATYPFVDEDLYANFFRWAYFSPTALLFRRSVIVEAGGWNEMEPACHEHELVLRLILAEKRFAFMPERLSVYRVQYINSISRSRPLRTYMDRMAISDLLEAYLTAKGEMTELRRLALVQARLLTARSAYLLNHDWSRRLCERALSAGRFVRPQSLNKYYWYAFRMLGFDSAERLAAMYRWIDRRWSSAQKEFVSLHRMQS